MSVFKKIISKEISANIIYEDEMVIAFYDINPKSKGHFLVVPKNFSKNLLTISEEDCSYLFSKAISLAKEKVAEFNAKGYQLIVNNEKEAGQEVFHTHIHIIPAY